jgi:phosphoenolpyruvate-protein phosphotransferase (PTS system enzyme I)
VLIQTAEATKKIHTGDSLIVDGFSGRVFINPAENIQLEYDRAEADLHAHQAALKDLIARPSMTRDGALVKLCANIGKSADAVAAKALNADGVGLYRTEFVFLVQDHFPSEEEQYQIYLNTANRVQQREVVIRTLDLGSDKHLPYFPLPFEANPSLGRRGIRREGEGQKPFPLR